MSHRRGESAEYALTVPQIQRALEVCHDLTDRMIIKLGVYLGLRADEMSHMKASWITQDGNLRFPYTQKCNCAGCARTRGRVWHPKTGAGTSLPIPKLLREDLTMLLRTQPDGLGISRQAIWMRTKAILKRANIRFEGPAQSTGFTHCLRATCATLLAANKMDEFAICYYMRWKDINMAKHYVQMMQIKPLAFQQAKAIFG